MKTVVVTWMDKTQETYHVDSAQVITQGVLYLQPASISEPKRRIPLNNVKIWTEDEA